ncbi:hypothetical protein C2W62_03800 [Candidatus Entotheonella serta]|nr:hypothetical protein C2W62_03800 [Candidatus Entotheonella serta]
MSIVSLNPQDQCMRYVFGPYEINLERYELCCDQRPVKIEPKAFDALAYLVQQHGRVVSKEELLDQLWADQYVSEGALMYCISEARKAIGDSGRTQRLIKTIHGRGYSFIAAVQRAEALDSAPPPDASETYERLV